MFLISFILPAKPSNKLWGWPHYYFCNTGISVLILFRLHKLPPPLQSVGFLAKPEAMEV